MRADIVIVASVGNQPKSLTIDWPARYEGVVAVGAVDRVGNHAGFSLTGPQVTVSAPGVEIETTGRSDGTGRGDGTSPATAITAGVVALIRSKFPKLSAAEVIHRLTATAKDAGTPGRDPEYGYGIVNPYAALTADVPTETPTGSPPTSPGTNSASTNPSEGPIPNRADKSGFAIVVVLIALGVLAAIWIRRAAARYRKSLD